MGTDQKLYQIYVINLDRSEDRRRRMEKELKERGILEYKRISGVDGKNLNEEEYILKNEFKRELVKGEIGCYLSHIKTLQLFLDSAWKFAVILEDDVKLAADFQESVALALKKYEALEEGGKWDLLKLYNNKRRHIFISALDQKRFIAACGPTISSGMLGTIWTREGAEKFLSKTWNKDQKPVLRRPVDCDLQHPWEYDLTICHLLPSTVFIRDQPSVIGETRGEKHSSFWGVLVYEGKRLLPKYKYYIDKYGWKKFRDSFILKKNDFVP